MERSAREPSPGTGFKLRLPNDTPVMGSGRDRISLAAPEARPARVSGKLLRGLDQGLKSAASRKNV